MQTTIKNKKKLPTGTRTSSINTAPSVYRDLRGMLEAGVTVYLKMDEALETIVAAHIGMTPVEARALAAKLIEAANKADALLAEAKKTAEE